jgi:hypothetical protein
MLFCLSYPLDCLRVANTCDNTFIGRLGHTLATCLHIPRLGQEVCDHYIAASFVTFNQMPLSSDYRFHAQIVARPQGAI